MKRRDFLKQVAATAAVGTVAPRVLVEPMWTMGVDTASNVKLGGVTVILKARSVGITTCPLAYPYRQLFLDTEVRSKVT